jgi:methanogenic corrinoid protein MtbC1
MTSRPMVAGALPTEMSEHGHLSGACLPDSLAAVIGLANGLSESARRSLQAPRGVRRPAHEGPPVALLARALETEVIPRLLLSRQEASEPAHILEASQLGPTAEDVESVTRLAMQGDLAGATAFLRGLCARGVPLERIYLQLLAPVARHLGELWSADRCDFATVTIGLCCLQQLVLENSQSFGPRPGRHGSVERRILLAPVPGEQHSFGLLMVGEFFRRQGWDVSSGTGASVRELVAMLRKQWFGMVGFSLACDSRLDILSALIRDIRRTSRNPRIGILVGGKAFIDCPELAALVGADATATDGQQAVLKAETLLALLVGED